MPNMRTKYFDREVRELDATLSMRRRLHSGRDAENSDKGEGDRACSTIIGVLSDFSNYKGSEIGNEFENAMSWLYETRWTENDKFRKHTVGCFTVWLYNYRCRLGLDYRLEFPYSYEYLIGITNEIATIYDEQLIQADRQTTSTDIKIKRRPRAISLD